MPVNACAVYICKRLLTFQGPPSQDTCAHINQAGLISQRVCVALAYSTYSALCPAAGTLQQHEHQPVVLLLHVHLPDGTASQL
jgi:predicted transcriptional regulator